MKVIKHDKLSIQHKVFSQGKRKFFSVRILAGFSFAADSSLLTEQDLWNSIQQGLPKGEILDLGYPKPEAEILIQGKCFTPGSIPAPSCPVSFSLGNIKRTLAVFGDRYWKRKWLFFRVPSEPEAFSSMDISWQRALGGKNFPDNLIGRGSEKITSAEGRLILPLPNVENPEQPTASPKSSAEPVSFAAMNPAWSGRLAQSGTYDNKWLRTGWPGLPEDCDWHVFMLAQNAQWQKHFFTGDEAFSCSNMHPNKPHLEGRLPGVRIRTFLNHIDPQGEEIFQECSNRLETIWLFPQYEFGVLIWQMLQATDASINWNINQLLAFPEKLANTPFSLKHYQAMLFKEAKEQTEPDTTVPPEKHEPDPAPAILAKPELPVEKNTPPEIQNQQAKLEKTRAMLDEKLKQMGIDPILFYKNPSQKRDSSYAHLAGLSKEEINAWLINHQKEREQKLSELFTKLGVSPDEPVKQNLAPSPMSIEKLEAMFLSLEIDDKGLVAELKATRAKAEAIQAQQKDIQKYSAEKMLTEEQVPEAEEPPPSDLTRDEVLKLYQTGSSFKGKNISGLDLSELNLSGARLGGAIAEKTCFLGTDLSGAVLHNCILSKADLSKAKLTNAQLCGCSAGSANFEQADLSGANLAKGQFSQANFTQALFDQAIMQQANFEQANFSAASCKKCNASQARFTRSILNESDWSDSELEECDFTASELFEVNFFKAKLNKCRFCQAKGQRANFFQADLAESRATQDTSLLDSDFRETEFTAAYWQKSALNQSRFTLACLNQAGFVSCQLNEANFHHVIAKEANFNESDLSQANMQYINLFKASLRGAILELTDLSRSNLFSVDFTDCRFKHTNLKGSNLKRTILMARAQVEAGTGEKE